jgi:hypothetical protein
MRHIGAAVSLAELLSQFHLDLLGFGIEFDDLEGADLALGQWFGLGFSGGP